MKHVVLVGGSGFIGTRTSELLRASGVAVRVIDKKEPLKKDVAFRKADVRDIHGLRKEISDGDVLVNLAAEHKDNVSPVQLYYDVNVEGARNICQIANERGIRKIIFTSSVAVYGMVDEVLGEDGPINPFNDYGSSKAQAEEVYRNWQQEEPAGRSLVIIRPTVVFGENNRGNVYSLLKYIASGRFMMIGSGKNIKSMAYVENVAGFISHCVQAKPGCYIYNYIDKPDLDMNSLVSFVEDKLGRKTKRRLKIPYVFGVIVGAVLDLVGCITKKKFSISKVRIKKFCSSTQFETSLEETGYVRPSSLMGGLEKTIKYEFQKDKS